MPDQKTTSAPLRTDNAAPIAVNAERQIVEQHNFSNEANQASDAGGSIVTNLITRVSDTHKAPPPKKS